MEKNGLRNVALVYGAVVVLSGSFYGLHMLEKQAEAEAVAEAMLNRPMTSAELFDHAQERNVVVNHDNGSSFGSGFFVSPRRILTANHVVAGIDDGTVTINTENGLTLETDIIYTDADRDIAVLEVQANADFTFYSFGNLASDSRGLHIYGHPYNRERDTLVSATYSGTRVTQVTTYSVLYGHVGPGMSGGPVFDDRGRIVGMTVSRLMENGFVPTPFTSIVNVDDLQDALDECDSLTQVFPIDIFFGDG